MTGNFSFATVLFLVFAGLSGCKKDENESTIKPNLQIRLTDAPGDFREVNIEIKEVLLHHSNTAAAHDPGWLILPLLRPGIYNLLTLNNGIDTLLVSTYIPEGLISQIRLVLGNNNTVKLKDGTIKHLSTPAWQQAGLRLNVHTQLTPKGLYKFLIDFDAAKSIVKTGSNTYKLKPVLRLITDEVTGAISGRVFPATASPTIYALQPPDTVAANFIEDNGEFIIRGLESGSYTIRFEAGPDLLDVEQTVVVNRNQPTDMGTVMLQ